MWSEAEGQVQQNMGLAGRSCEQDLGASSHPLPTAHTWTSPKASPPPTFLLGGADTSPSPQSEHPGWRSAKATPAAGAAARLLCHSGQTTAGGVGVGEQGEEGEEGGQLGERASEMLPTLFKQFNSGTWRSPTRGFKAKMIQPRWGGL